MFKKLDKLIIKAFIGPFIATFFITLLVLVMQFFWLYIDDFVGKGLGTNLIFEFIWYQSAVLVPLADSSRCGSRNKSGMTVRAWYLLGSLTQL